MGTVGEEDDVGSRLDGVLGIAASVEDWGNGMASRRYRLELHISRERPPANPFGSSRCGVAVPR
jgi:hypothetical protein